MSVYSSGPELLEMLEKLVVLADRWNEGREGWQEIEKACDLIERITGVRPVLEG